MTTEPIFFLIMWDVNDTKKIGTHKFKRISKGEFELLHDRVVSTLASPECEIVDRRSFNTYTTTDVFYFIELTVKYTNNGMQLPAGEGRVS